MNISHLTRKTQQRTYFLRQLKKFNTPKSVMVQFYPTIIESILTSSITIRCAATRAKHRGRLPHVIHSAEKVIGCSLPSSQDLYPFRTLRMAGKIAVDPPNSGSAVKCIYFVPVPNYTTILLLSDKNVSPKCQLLWSFKLYVIILMIFILSPIFDTIYGHYSPSKVFVSATFLLCCSFSCYWQCPPLLRPH